MEADRSPAWNPLALNDAERFHRLLVSICLGTLFGFAGQWVGWRLPFRDPVEIVGQPLIRGYSERAEQFAMYGFVFASAVGSGLAAWGLSRLSRRMVITAGAVLAWLFLPALLLWPDRGDSTTCG